MRHIKQVSSNYMKIFSSKTDFKKLDKKMYLMLLFPLILTIASGYFDKELRPTLNGMKNILTRTESLIIVGIIDISIIVIILNLKKIKSITINEDSSLIVIDFLKGFNKNKRKTASLKSLRYKVETEDGKQNITLSDNKDFYFIITEDEFKKGEQLEIANYLKETNCKILN